MPMPMPMPMPVVNAAEAELGLANATAVMANNLGVNSATGFVGLGVPPPAFSEALHGESVQCQFVKCSIGQINAQVLPWSNAQINVHKMSSNARMHKHVNALTLLHKCTPILAQMLKFTGAQMLFKCTSAKMFKCPNVEIPNAQINVLKHTNKYISAQMLKSTSAQMPKCTPKCSTGRMLK